MGKKYVNAKGIVEFIVLAFKSQVIVNGHLGTEVLERARISAINHGFELIVQL